MKEAKGPPGKPTCPKWLDADAKLAWKQLVPVLAEMGVLTRIDRNALIRYCRSWVRWRKAEMFIERKGEVYSLKDDKGNFKCVQQWPQVAIAHKLGLTLTRLEQEFGMTPAARTRIHVEPVYVEDEFEKLKREFASDVIGKVG